MIPTGHSTPRISEYPQIADNGRQAIEDVYYGIKEPRQALDDAGAKSAKVLGWQMVSIETNDLSNTVKEFAASNGKSFGEKIILSAK